MKYRLLASSELRRGVYTIYSLSGYSKNLYKKSNRINKGRNRKRSTARGSLREYKRMKESNSEKAIPICLVMQIMRCVVCHVELELQKQSLTPFILQAVFFSRFRQLSNTSYSCPGYASYKSSWSSCGCCESHTSAPQDLLVNTAVFGLPRQAPPVPCPRCRSQRLHKPHKQACFQPRHPAPNLLH